MLRSLFRLEKIWVANIWHFGLNVSKICCCWSDLIGYSHDNIDLVIVIQPLPGFTAKGKSFHIFSSVVFLVSPSIVHVGLLLHHSKLLGVSRK